jgi:hypothetical protein
VDQEGREDGTRADDVTSAALVHRAFLFCGGMDTTVPCSTVMNAYNGITNQFYGPSCTLCQDAAWQVMRKMMDQ